MLIGCLGRTFLGKFAYMGQQIGYKALRLSDNSRGCIQQSFRLRVDCFLQYRKITRVCKDTILAFLLHKV